MQQTIIERGKNIDNILYQDKSMDSVSINRNETTVFSDISPDVPNTKLEITMLVNEFNNLCVRLVKIKNRLKELGFETNKTKQSIENKREYTEHVL